MCVRDKERRHDTDIEIKIVRDVSVETQEACHPSQEGAKQDAIEKERGLEVKIESETENDHKDWTNNTEGQHAQGEDGVHQMIEVHHASIMSQQSSSLSGRSPFLPSPLLG